METNPTPHTQGEEQQHDFEISNLGLGTCKRCGYHATVPQWPNTCTPKRTSTPTQEPHQPSEGWVVTDTELAKYHKDDCNVHVMVKPVCSCGFNDALDVVLNKILTTARREERRTIAADITKILHSKKPSVFLQKYIDEELLAPLTSSPTPRN